MAETAAQQALSGPKPYHWRESAPKRGQKASRKRLMELIDAENIADQMGEEELGRLGQKVSREFEVDIQSRAEWQEANDEAMKLAQQLMEQKNFPWPKAANIKYPLLTVAAIQFAARAYPAIINGPDIVKGRVRGNDDGIPAQQPTGLQGQLGQEPFAGAPGGPQPQGLDMLTGGFGAEQAGLAPQQAPQAPQQPPQQQWKVEPGAKKKRADRVGRHMSYQLLDEMEEWEPETDKLLHVLPILGCAFRKSRFSPSLGRNVSELVLPSDFVVHYYTKSLATCPRATHVIRLYPYEIEERIRDSRFIDFDYGQSAGSEPDDEESLHEFLEQYRLEDLDEDGYPEPYTVTVHKETSKTVRIVARFDGNSISYGDKGQVTRIKGEEYFTKYGFIPSFDGSFYDIGFGFLLRPMSEAINGAINRMLDAGTLQNMGGGFIGSGMRIKGGDARFRPGEYKRVTSVGGSIKDNIVMMPFPGPSQSLFNLLGLLIDAARDITSVKDIMTGDAGPEGEAASRTMARIEQGMKVFSAIYKRLFRSLKSEFKKLARLNRLYLEPDTYFTLLDDPEAIGPDDYDFDDLDILPVADPSMVTEVQKLAQAQFLQGFLGDTYIEPLEARKRIFSAVGITDFEGLLKEQPAPDPEISAKADEIEVKKREVEIKGQQAENARMKAEAEVQRVQAVIEELKSQAILNLAKAEEAGNSTSIESMRLALDTINEHGRQALEAGKAMDTREANEQKAKTDERRSRSVAGSSSN